MIKCKRCGEKIRSYSPMRKWCTDCRKVVNMEYIKARKIKPIKK